MTLTLDPITERSLNALQSLSSYEQDLVLKTLETLTSVEPVDSQSQALSDAIAGEQFSREEKTQLELDTLTRHFEHRRVLLANVLTAPQVAKLLGTTRQTPHDRVGSQTLLAIRENGKWLFPAWQFDPTGDDGILDGMPDILKVLEMSDYAKLNWFMRSNPYLEGLTPIQALKNGDVDQVLEQAEAAGTGQWS